MGIDAQDMLITLAELLRIVHRPGVRQAACVGLYIGAAEALVEVDSPDHAPQPAVLLQHSADPVRPFLLCPELQVRIHQMAGIQHNALILILNAIQQAPGKRRHCEGEARPPLVLH